MLKTCVTTMQATAAVIVIAAVRITSNDVLAVTCSLQKSLVVI